MRRTTSVSGMRTARPNFVKPIRRVRISFRTVQTFSPKRAAHSPTVMCRARETLSVSFPIPTEFSITLLYIQQFHGTYLLNAFMTCLRLIPFDKEV